LRLGSCRQHAAAAFLSPASPALSLPLAAAAAAAARQAFRALAAYLRSKGRAGVVDLPPTAAAPGVGRFLYLIPPPDGPVASGGGGGGGALGLAWDGRAPLLLAAEVEAHTP